MHRYAVELVRDLFGTPEIASPATYGRPLAGSFFGGFVSDDSADLRRKVTELHELANKQAQDISELRCRHELEAVDFSEKKLQGMLEAARQQQSSLAEGHCQVRELVLALQAQQRQQEEWRELYNQTNCAHAEVVKQLQAQVEAQAGKMRASAGAYQQRSKLGVRVGLQQAARAVSAMKAELATLKKFATDHLAAGQEELIRDAGQLAQLVKIAEARQVEMAGLRRDACMQLQLLRGSIRVLCRCRPLNASEVSAGTRSAVELTSQSTVAVLEPNRPAVELAFDAALPLSCSQRQAFAEVSPAVAQVLDGQYVCVLSYGQTGSGKTFTMSGSEAAPGMACLAAEQLLREAQVRRAEASAQGHTLEVEMDVSMVEIYNDRLFDLLASDDASSSGATTHGAMYAPPEPALRVSPNGQVSVEGLRVELLTSPEAMPKLIARGAARRRTFGTLANATSSRSHMVLMLCARMVRSDGYSWSGKLLLCDLAGSERISQTGAEGARLREAQHINKSLSALEQVFLALQQRQGQAGGQGSACSTPVHVPYRNSKLTLLLSEALGAKGLCAQTVLLLHVNPTPAAATETLRTLRFGERCRSICLGAVRRGKKQSGMDAAIEAADARARKLQEELDQTRQELAESQRFASELQRSAQQRRRSSDSSSHSDEHRAEESNGGDGGDATPGLHAPVLLGEHANVVPCAHVVAGAQLEPRTPRPDPVTVDATVNTPRPVKNKSQRKSQARRGHKTAQAGVAAAGNAENDGRACNSSRACQREQRPRSAASKAPGRLVPVARVLQPRFTDSSVADTKALEGDKPAAAVPASAGRRRQTRRPSTVSQPATPRWR